MSGPLQLIAMSFPPGAQPGQVLAEIDRVQARGGMRVLDMLWVATDEEGRIVPLTLGAEDELGELVSRAGSVFGEDGEHPGEATTQLRAQIRSLPPGSSVGVVLVEHRWAEGIFGALAEEGGALLGAGFLSPERAGVINDEIAASEAAVDAIDALVSAELIVAYADEAAARAVRADTAAVAVIQEAAAEMIAEDMAAVAVAERQMSDAAVAASVTPAEIRVLRYLSTKLTFALIADKLGISRGAAKMRAERTYQRLGVHSRAQAVERARALRVIP